MSSTNRRDFMSHSAGVTLGLAAGGMVASRSAAARESSPNERLSLAVVGIRGRGRHLARDFASQDDCLVTYLCDVDQSLFEPRAKEVEEIQGSPPRTVSDFRRMLEDPDVDAVIVATPDHWHALATVWACQHGKDVFVEKPICHSPWEGRKMVEAARRYDRVVQVGTQNRSAPYNHEAKQYLESGRLGTIHFVRVCNQKYQPNLPAVNDQPPPPHLDWEMWTGPAEKCPYNPNFHNRWHHFWNFSGGDICNDAVHQLDLARWLVDLDYPKTVYSTGGRFAEDGVLETPDTQVAVYEFDKLVMTLELSLYTPYMLKSDAELRDSDMFPHWPQNATRIEIFGTKGLMVVGRMGGGWQVFDRPKSRHPVVAAQAYGRFPDPEHQRAFIDAVRTRGTPPADIEEGHRSTLLCHYANISYRLGGRKLIIDAATETFQGDDQANRMLKRTYRPQWAVPETV